MCISLSIYLFMRKCIIFDIVFGEMHDLLDWKFYKHLSLILGELFEKVIGLLWFLKMLYHWFCGLIYVLETFKGLRYVLIKLLGNELRIFIMLTCELFLLFYPCAITIVIIWWLPSWMPFTCGPNEAPSRITTYLWA